jgi:UPF0716 protein FxsA
MPFLVVLFIVVPLAELAVIIAAGRAFGILETLLALFAISIAGAWLAKTQGLGVLQRIRAEMDAGRMPASELIDGALILVGAVLLLTPGFLTDLVAVGLLVPPGRRVVRGVARSVIASRFAVLRAYNHGRRARRVWTVTRPPDRSPADDPPRLPEA